MNEIKNARIESVSLGIEDHGHLTCFLNLDYGNGTHQSFGGYSLDEPTFDEEHNFINRVGSAYGMQFIKSVIDTVGCSSWEKLQGNYIRVEIEDWYIVAIGNIIKDVWFNPKKDLNSYLAKNA